MSLAPLAQYGADMQILASAALSLTRISDVASHAGLAILIGVGVAYKHELKDFLEQFVAVLDTWGPVRSALASCQAANVLCLIGIGLELFTHHKMSPQASRRISLCLAGRSRGLSSS